MKYIADTTEFQITEPTIVTLGKFDGRHRGHQKLLRAMKDLKGKTGWATAIFTFSIAPAAVMKGEPETVITTSLERRRNMEKMDIDYLVEYPFDDQVRRTSLKAAISALLKLDMIFYPLSKMMCLAARIPASCSQVALSAPSSIMPAPFW